MQELFALRQEVIDLLMQELETCRQSGIRYAENEAEYRKALRIAILGERAKGTPATVTGDICRGMEDIADMKMARDSAEAVYKSSQEYINVLKLRLRIIQADIEREWSRPDGNGGF